MGGILGGFIQGFIQGILGLFSSGIGNIISLILWGGDALICGIGNWIANAITGVLAVGGVASWVNVFAYGSYFLDMINGILGGIGALSWAQIIGIVINAIMGWG